MWFALGSVGVADGWSGVLTLGACVLLIAAAPFSVGAGYGSTTLIGAAAGHRIRGGLGVVPARTRATTAVLLGALAAPVIAAAVLMPRSADVAEGAAWVLLGLAAATVCVGGE